MNIPWSATQLADSEIDEVDLYPVLNGLICDYMARAQRPLPAINSDAFLAAGRDAQVAGFLVLAAAYLRGVDMADEVFDANYGRYHRANLVPAISELDRRRYPPSGDRDLWVRYGPDGSAGELREVAA